MSKQKPRCKICFYVAGICKACGRAKDDRIAELEIKTATYWADIRGIADSLFVQDYRSQRGGETTCEYVLRLLDESDQENNKLELQICKLLAAHSGEILPGDDVAIPDAGAGQPFQKHDYEAIEAELDGVTPVPMTEAEIERMVRFATGTAEDRYRITKEIYGDKFTEEKARRLMKLMEDN